MGELEQVQHPHHVFFMVPKPGLEPGRVVPTTPSTYSRGWWRRAREI